MRTKPFPPELISTVHRCFRGHLRANRIKILNEKLVCYILIGGSNRLIMLIMVPPTLRKLIFDAYHTSGIGGHLGINKTVIVLRLRVIWPDIRKNVIA